MDVSILPCPEMDVKKILNKSRFLQKICLTVNRVYSVQCGKKEVDLMKIQAVESCTGLDRPSIRFYEKEGLLNPQRLENGYREYSEQDVELLLKIKLLRRLGMSVEKIRALQQGSADLLSAVVQQIQLHNSQIDEHRRCRAVCETMQRDGVAFQSLDAPHYLRLLQEIRIDDRVLAKSSFSENIPKEIHPWKRYFARTMDYMLWSGLVQLILFVIIRIRPIPGDFVSRLISIGSMALFVPVEALLLSKFGTTPGKYIMGIRIHYYQGGYLPYGEAMERSTQVFIQGTGCGVPIVALILYIKRFCQLTGRSFVPFARYDNVQMPQDMDWDYQSELMYEERNWKRGVALALLLTAWLGLTCVTTLDSFKPKYLGTDLTIAQVAQNYNATLKLMGQNVEHYDKLQKDGTKNPVPSNTAVLDLNGSVGDARMAFIYDTEDGYVRSVSIYHEWNDVFQLSPLTGDALNMTYSLLLAQGDCGIRELLEFTKLYESKLDQQSVSFGYRNIWVEWEIRSDVPMVQGVITGYGDEDVWAVLDFTVTIQK